MVLAILACAPVEERPVEPAVTPLVDQAAPADPAPPPNDDDDAAAQGEQRAWTSCASDHGFADRPQLCTELSRHDVEVGEQRDYEQEWGEQTAAFPLGLELLVVRGEGASATLVESAFIENLSGAGFRDVVELGPVEATTDEQLRQSATITIWCRGFYPDPDDESSYVEPGECGATRVVVEPDGAGAKIQVSQQ